MKLGFDIGNVIMGSKGKEDTSFFGPNYLLTPDLPGAIDSLLLLTKRFGSENVFLVSKCRDNVQRKTREWFEHHAFFTRTDITPANLHFCYERKEKAGICEAHGIELFVDDKLDVLEPMEGKVRHRFLFAPSQRDAERSDQNDGIFIVSDWKELMACINRIKVPEAAK